MSTSHTSAELRLKSHGHSGAGFARLAEALRLEGRLEDAIQVSRQGIAQYPSQVSGYLVLGKCLLVSGLNQEARIEFEAALRLDSRCPTALQALARIAVESKRRGAAIGYYQSILDMDPWDKEAEAYLAGKADAQALRGFDAEFPKGMAPAATVRDLDTQLDALFAWGEDIEPPKQEAAPDPTSIEAQLDRLFLTEAPLPIPAPTVISATTADDEAIGRLLDALFGEEESKKEPMAVVAPQAVSASISDDEGYPEEDEERGDGSGSVTANVATVTLAEIYFQQGLKEQALQIYRRLLELEPGNQSVGKRIREIEASKAEDGGIRSLGDFRKPLPGLKVPKRKM